MDETKKVATVVQGEAPESDEEDVSSSSLPPVQKSPIHGVVVSGEASESEDEVDANQQRLPPLTVHPNSEGDKADITNIGLPQSPTSPYQDTVKPKYDTLLHKKLRERNIAFRQRLVDTVLQAYTLSARDLHNNTLQLLKTQGTLQDIANHMRVLTNDLFHLEDKVDTISTCTILPEITLPLVATGALATNTADTP
ncbi:hypothetical protein CHS0354_000226 [Potamilus streckersoni]|uniref:Biogenesis of lysosome-related organelles complex 1 subunit 3 n=1 Tax=Potamilus streckersoni TaxID=2493646 RepID=A0AAE0VHI2_9BIVA|nr:hypothetical protein CHS0354_000226 [Potamilus streckersoni]